MLRKKVTDFCLKSNQSYISKNKPRTLFFIILNSKYSLFVVSLKASITASFDNEEYIYFYDGAVLEIYLDHKVKWPREGLNCKSLAYEVVT